MFQVRLANRNLHPLPFPVRTALLSRELAGNLDDTGDVNLLKHKKTRYAVLDARSGVEADPPRKSELAASTQRTRENLSEAGPSATYFKENSRFSLTYP